MPERRISELDFCAYRWAPGCQLIGNGKFGALPFFLAPKSNEPLDHQERDYASSGWVSMKSSITCPVPDVGDMKVASSAQ
jgi:hypothetical protein